ncbi:MAG TPA: FecR domain-containing protein, partial [Xanthobacteraceae bacterium]|nr:FecR domain-containing protein [Xanthobacteraceae bacterium]
MRRRGAWLGTVSSLVIAGYLLQSPSAYADKIGVASAVNQRVEGVNGGATRTLSVGSDVFTNEVVRTGDDSNAQLLFRDQTSLSVGPGSEVRLDKYVFDPARGAGEVVLNATKGAFRFISGVQQSSSYQIKTPAGTLGVRGTIFDILLENDTLTAILIDGSMFARTSDNKTIELSIKGDGFVLNRGGQLRFQKFDLSKIKPGKGVATSQANTNNENTTGQSNNDGQNFTPPARPSSPPP